MFNAALEGIFRRLDWDRKGINLNGDHLNHLSFAGNIVLITNNAEKLEEMLNELNKESKNIGLRINMKKKVMFNRYDKVKQNKEVKRRTQIGWSNFGKLNDIMKSNMPICLKRRICDQCMIPSMIYGETWAVTINGTKT